MGTVLGVVSLSKVEFMEFETGVDSNTFRGRKDKTGLTLNGTWFSWVEFDGTCCFT